MENKSNGNGFMAVILIGIAVGMSICYALYFDIVDGLCGAIHPRSISLYRECKQHPLGEYGEKYNINP